MHEREAECAARLSFGAKLCTVVYVMQTLKGTISPYMIRNIHCSNFHSCLSYDIIFRGEVNESNKMFKLKRRSFE
jgi:hypothetical protein